MFTKDSLFEFHDQPWFPSSIRNEVTLFLRELWTLDLPLGMNSTFCYTSPYKAAAGILKETLEKLNQKKSAEKLRNLNGAYQLVDFCSGSGGIELKVRKQ